MRLRSIGLRLTLWYAGILSAALLVFSGAVWFALEHSLYHAIDESLRDRVRGVREFIELQTGSLSLEEMRLEFREHSVLGPGGDLFQVADAHGQWLYRSDPLYDEHAPIYRVDELGAQFELENVMIQDIPLRFLSENVDVNGKLYAVTVAAPLGELERGIREFLWILVPAVPVTLLVASFGGYWLSRRALRPVDQLTEAARSISADNLSHRLAVPASGDELERLSRTLNEMIGRLDASFKRISRFTADASHELRTPLAIMRTTADVALRGGADHLEHREALEDIVLDLERASQIVDNLLLIARADSGEPGLRLVRIDVVETIRRACSEGAVLARAKGIRFDVRLPHHPVDAIADDLALRRLFLLLIDNAVKYTQAGGLVCVAATTDERFVIVSIEDNGIGIEARNLSLIFERFYRADESRSRERGGAGLGLAIGRWIAEAHGGTLSVRSEVGRGSVFTVRIPRCT